MSITKQQDSTETTQSTEVDVENSTTQQDATTSPKQGRIKLTPKQKVFVREVLKNPTEPIYRAVQKGYNVKDKNVAMTIASENMRKPQIMRYLEKHSEQAENTVIEVMEYSKKLGKTGDKAGASYASVALASANSILDRVHGKPKQSIDLTSKSVVLNVDLTSAS